MPTTNPPATVQEAADRLYAAALRLAEVADGTSELTYAEAENGWQEALDTYVTARLVHNWTPTRNTEEGAR